jgi:hypothetical protein
MTMMTMVITDRQFDRDITLVGALCAVVRTFDIRYYYIMIDTGKPLISSPLAHPTGQLQPVVHHWSSLVVDVDGMILRASFAPYKGRWA